MITETIYAGKDNTFSLRLVRGGEQVNLISITGYSITLSNGKVFTSVDNPDSFKEKPNGVVEISIGDLLTEDDQGTQTAFLVTFDPVNVHGVQWPNFKLKVR